MSIEYFTEIKCSKCGKVVRKAGTKIRSTPGWTHMVSSIYGEDGGVKQFIPLDLCPSCTIQMMKFLGVPRKRTRRAIPGGQASGAEESSQRATESLERTKAELDAIIRPRDEVIEAAFVTGNLAIGRSEAELDVTTSGKADLKGCIWSSSPHEHDEEGKCIPQVSDVPN